MHSARDLALHQAHEGVLVDLTVAERRHKRREDAPEQRVGHGEQIAVNERLLNGRSELAGHYGLRVTAAMTMSATSVWGARVARQTP
jgi:hypothetical protein